MGNNKIVLIVFVVLHFDATQNGGNGRAGFFGGGGGGPPTSSLISVKLVMGSGGFSGGTSPLTLPPVMLFCCLAGNGGGRSSPDDELIVEATLFCDGDEQTPSPLKGRLTVDERLSLTTSERSGRLAVNCWVNSITTVGDEAVSLELALFTVSVDDDTSKEWALEPIKRRHRARIIIIFRIDEHKQYGKIINNKNIRSFSISGSNLNK